MIYRMCIQTEYFALMTACLHQNVFMRYTPKTHKSMQLKLKDSDAIPKCWFLLKVNSD